MNTPNDFLRRYFPFSMNLVFYVMTSFSMAKIEKYLGNKINVIVFPFHIYIPNSKKIGLKIQVCPSSPQSQIQIGDFTQNGEGCNSKGQVIFFFKYFICIDLIKNIWEISQFLGPRPPFTSDFLPLHFFTPSHIQSTISELFIDRFSPFNVQSVLKYLVFNFNCAKSQFFSNLYTKF